MRRFLKGLGWTIGILAVLVGLARLFLFRVWTVPSDPSVVVSIAPTLEEGDVVLLLTRGDREAGDLVRCPHPSESRWLVGRIAGTAGDKVVVAGNFVQINGRKYRTTDACLEEKVHVTTAAGKGEDLSCQRVDFGGDWHYILMGPDAEDSDEKTVGPDSVFLVSDNRNDFFDSRDFGDLPASSCQDKIVFRLWGKEGFFQSKHRFDYIR